MVNPNLNNIKKEAYDSQPVLSSDLIDSHEQKEEQKVFLEISLNLKNESDKEPEILLTTSYVDGQGNEQRWEYTVPETSFWHVGDIAQPPAPLPDVDKGRLHGEERVIRNMLEAAHASATANSLENATFYASGLLRFGLKDVQDLAIQGQIIDQFVAAAQEAVIARPTEN